MSNLSGDPMITYDPKVLYKFAQRLYGEAFQVVVTSTIIGVVIGAVPGYFLDKQNGALALIGAVLVGAFGYSFGAAKAFSLRLQAQTALCQVRIEENTRKQTA